MERLIRGVSVRGGNARGVSLASTQPLSFWGGYDPVSGEIIDRRHDLSGQIGAGKILIIPYTVGSSTTTGILLQSVRSNVAPAAIITNKVDPFLALAAIVADKMYGRSFPIVTVEPGDFERFEGGEDIVVSEDGTITVLVQSD